MPDTATKDTITLVIAVVGAVLGIYNAWRAVSKDRIRLIVTPSNWVVADGMNGIVIEVVNMGFVAVTISQVAFRLKTPKKYICVIIPGFLTGQKLPHRLEPRTAVSIHVSPEVSCGPQMANVRDAFAKTACGCIFYGNSPALKVRIAAAAKATCENDDS